MANIFDSAAGGTISGVFGGTDSDDTIVFSSINGTDGSLDGFIIDSYVLDWVRAVSYKRAYNKKGNVVILGKGAGTLTLKGLVGPADDFERLLDATSGNDVCKNANCVIKTGGGYSTCDSSGNKTTSSKPLTITAKGIVHTSINMTGALQEGSVTLTSATMTFKVGGVSIN